MIFLAKESFPLMQDESSIAPNLIMLVTAGIEFYKWTRSRHPFFYDLPD